jgi:hypothetical protein
MLNNQRELHERMTSVIQRLPVSTSGSIAKTTNKKPTALQEVSSRVNTINDDVRPYANNSHSIWWTRWDISATTKRKLTPITPFRDTIHPNRFPSQSRANRRRSYL